MANKESNRITEMQKVLKQIGVRSLVKKDEMIIYGQNYLSIKDKIINVPKLGDHRICMASAILSLVTGIKAKINNFETVNTSSPNFLNKIKFLGAKFEIQN